MTASQMLSSEKVLGFQGPNAIEASWTDRRPRYVMIAQSDAHRDRFIAFGGSAGRITLVVRGPWALLGRFVERARGAGAEIVRMAGFPKDRALQVVRASQLTRDDVLPVAVAKQLKRLRARSRWDTARSVAALTGALSSEETTVEEITFDGSSIIPFDTGSQPPVRDIHGAFLTLSSDGTVVAA